MATTIFVDGTAGSDSNDGSDAAHAKQTLAACTTGGLFANDDITLKLCAGTSINAVSTASPFRTASGKSLTIQAYGGGAKPRLVVPSNGLGFRATGTGSIDFQDVALVSSGVVGNGVESRTGGGCRLARVDIEGFFNSGKIGTGTVLVEDSTFRVPGNNGLMIDAHRDSPVGNSGIIRRSQFYQANPTDNDMLVLHDGGYGLRTGWLIEDFSVIAGSGSSCESGMDLQQQFSGTIVRDGYISGALQWGFVQGSLLKAGGTHSFATKAAMLAKFIREEGGPGAGTEVINGGHCAFVTADGGNNGIYQLTGSDPSLSASWTGPMSAADLAATPTLIYRLIVENCAAGMQVQHPGTQLSDSVFRDITLGPWGSGGGTLLKFYEMAWDCEVWNTVFSSRSGGSASTRVAVRVDQLPSQVAQRTRARLKNCVIRQRANHTGSFVQFESANDHGYLVSDYNAWLADEGVSDGAWPDFASTNGTNRTYSAFQTANSSDSHSLWQTPTTANVDGDSRPQTGSNLIGAGVARSTLDGDIPATDLEGRTIASPPDIGAYSFFSDAQEAAVLPTARRMLRVVRTAATPPIEIDPPGTVTGLAESADSSTSISFTWDDEPLSSYYELRYAPTGTPDWTTFGTQFASEVGTITVLSGAYDVQVRGVNASGEGAWSASVTASTS